MSLSTIKVVEFAGLAPAPFAGLVLADNGASVIRVDRPDSTNTDVLCRNKRSLAVDLKTPSGLAILKKLIAQSHVLIDPYRPGVMERLGLGPDVCLRLNPSLVYARIVGFPSSGPQKDMAGHDINYLAASGVLSILPAFPLNLLADFAAGGLIAALAILLALRSGQGQVLDTDMVSGLRYLSSFALIHKSISSPLFSHPLHANILDGGAPFYSVYECSDGRHMSLGCLEPRFYAVFLHHFHRSFHSAWHPSPAAQMDRQTWPRLREYIASGFKSNTRDYWAAVFHGTDACAVPVLTVAEVPIPAAHLLLPGEHNEEILAELMCKL